MKSESTIAVKRVLVVTNGNYMFSVYVIISSTINTLRTLNKLHFCKIYIFNVAVNVV